MKCAIRADASQDIGTGHLMRCLTLADGLAAQGGQIVFLCSAASVRWKDLIESHGHVWTPINVDLSTKQELGPTPSHSSWLAWGQQDDAEAVLELLPDLVDLVVVDHYALDYRWERAVRSRAKRILAIDDLADRAHDCDVLLDQNGYEDDTDRYAQLIPIDVHRLYGPRYALLRPAFQAAQVSRSPLDGHVRRILVFMGGVDAAGASITALAALSRSSLSQISVDVVIGGANPYRGELELLAGARQNVDLHVDLANPAVLFARADLAIGAGGISALERCCVGLPTVAISVAENQDRGLTWLRDKGAVRYLGPFAKITEQVLADAVLALCNAPEEVKAMGTRAKSIVDGFGTARVIRSLRQSGCSIAVRRATMEDAQLLHLWRDAADVRAMSMESAPIPYAEHCRWLARALQDPEHIVLVAMLGQQAVGSLRYRLGSGDATTSIVVAPAMRGEGIGNEILCAGEVYLRETNPMIRRILAIVRPENRASARLFGQAGFELDVREASRLVYCKRIR